MQTIRFVFTLPDVRIVSGIRKLQQHEFREDSVLYHCCNLYLKELNVRIMGEMYEPSAS